ncbi:MAG: glycoside hydrolase family 19 protein, partial [Candidatus Nitrosocosmicus sp.]
MDRTVFFNSIRDSIFKGILTQSQVDGCNAILDIFSGYDNRQIAYCLATAYHETGHTMKPIEEYGKGAGHKYGQKIDMNGKPYTTPDKIYYGRGPVQITWRSNYSYFTQQAKNHGHSWDFLNNPELML